MTNVEGKIFQFLFIPITLYLIIGFTNHLTHQSPVFGSTNIWMRLLIFYCLVVTSTLVVAGFMSSQSTPDLVTAIAFSPLAVFFLISIWPQPPKFKLNPSSQRQYTAPTVSGKTRGLVDENKRDFLKILGTAGLTIFLYNLFFRRDASPLFGNSSSDKNSAGHLSLKNAQGEVINPAENSPTAGYYISQIDDGDTSYFGFVNNLGQWYIMRQDIDNSYRYVKGDKDFDANWSSRTKQSYDYFDNVF